MSGSEEMICEVNDDLLFSDIEEGMKHHQSIDDEKKSDSPSISEESTSKETTTMTDDKCVSSLVVLSMTKDQFVSEIGLKEWTTQVDINGDLLEMDRSGNPLFIRKLSDFVHGTHDPWDLIQAQYLFVHRQNISADSTFTWKDADGDLLRHNALHYCAGFPILSKMLQWFLDEGSINPNHPTDDRTQNTPLTLAAYANNIAALKMLIDDRRVNVNATNSDGLTPLMWAVMNNHVSMVTILIDRGCDLSVRDPVYKETAMGIARRKGHSQILQILQQRSKKTNNQNRNTMIVNPISNQQGCMNQCC